MALIKCPECGKDISDQSRKCPNCGYPIQKKTPVGKIVIIALVCLAAIIAGLVIFNVKVVAPKKNYEEAVSLYEGKEYDQAEAKFRALGDYKDSAHYLDLIANARTYNEAVDAYNNEEYDKAEELFGEVSDFSDAGEYLEQIDHEKIYKDARDLYDAKEYTQARGMLAGIADYKDAGDMIAAMDADIAYNDAVDSLTRYGFYAESVEKMACSLIDDISDVWYNSSYENSSYTTDAFTRDPSGEFYDDVTALGNFYQSDAYAYLQEGILTGSEEVDALYASLEDAPERLADCVEKAGEVQSAYTDLVDFALNADGSLASVTLEARSKNSAFETAYAQFKESIPKKITIDPSAEKEYDFRKMNFGMSADEVLQSEKAGYDLEEDYDAYGLITYLGVSLDDETPANITYVTDDFRFVDGAWVEFAQGTSEEEVRQYLADWYGDRYDGAQFVTSSNAEYPYIDMWIFADEEQTILYITPLTQEAYETRSEEVEALPAMETEAETEAEEGAALIPGNETEAETEAVLGNETEAETEAVLGNETEAEILELFAAAQTEAETEAVLGNETEAEILELFAAAETEAEEVLAEVESEAEAVLAAATETEAETEAVLGNETEAEILELFAAAETEAEEVLAEVESEAEAVLAVAAQTEAETEAVPGNETEAEILELFAAAETEAEELLAAVESEAEEALAAAETEAEEVLAAIETEAETETLLDNETEEEQDRVQLVLIAPETEADSEIGELNLVLIGTEAETESKAMTYAEYEAAELDEPVLIEAYVQAKQSWYEDNPDVGTDTAVIYAQDEDGGYFLYNVPVSKEVYDQLEVGTKIRVSGYKAEWAGEIEIVADDDLTPVEILDGTYAAQPADVTEAIGSEEALGAYINQLVSFKGMTVEAANVTEETEAEAAGEEAVPFLYGWDGSGSEGDDLYFTASKNGVSVTFVVESYLCGPDTDVYQAVKNLQVGDVVDLEGFLYWYEGAQPHITGVSVIPAYESELTA